MTTDCIKLHKWFNELKRYNFSNLTDLNSECFKNGIYVCFEKGETAHNDDRIVRIGSHDINDNLLVRLKNHIGSSLRKSVLRRHIDNCMNPDGNVTSTDITEYIKKNITFVLIPNIPIRAERLRLEAGLISTINNCDDCKASNNWLGLNHKKEKIVMSGLWNIHNLDKKKQLTESEMNDIKELIKRKK